MKFLTILYLLLIPSIGISQTTETDVSEIQVFDRSRCDTIYKKFGPGVEHFPHLYRSNTVSKIYDFDEFVSFRVFEYSGKYEEINLIFQGKCRGFSHSFPIPKTGIYYVRFYHHQKPSLLKLTVTSGGIKEEFLAACSIHQ